MRDSALHCDVPIDKKPAVSYRNLVWCLSRVPRSTWVPPDNLHLLMCPSSGDQQGFQSLSCMLCQMTKYYCSESIATISSRVLISLPTRFFIVVLPSSPPVTNISNVPAKATICKLTRGTHSKTAPRFSSNRRKHLIFCFVVAELNGSPKPMHDLGASVSISLATRRYIDGAPDRPCATIFVRKVSWMEQQHLNALGRA
jgi:hypothetical protein